MTENKQNLTSTKPPTLPDSKSLNRNLFNFGRVIFGVCLIATFFTEFCDTKTNQY